MKRPTDFFIFLILIACTTPKVTTASVPVGTTKVNEIVLSPFPTATVIPSVAPTRTPTPETPCDPFVADYCITDGHFLLQRPIPSPGNDLIDPGYRYGSTAHGTREPHHGVEFPNASGTAVGAAAEGKVVFAGSDQEARYAPWAGFYGNLVVIEHQDELFTLYAHLSRIDVGVNQMVSVGAKIGEVGSTGAAIGSHLHFEVRRGEVEDYFAVQNPELWLVPASDGSGAPFGTLVISLVDAAGNLVQNANFTIGYYLDPSRPPDKTYYATPYAPDLLHGAENVVLGELPAGSYRIAVQTNGKILERWVEVESGRLTQVVLAVK